ncbi:MAG: thioredoxin domain-containing protein [Caldilineaceae bacterium]
MPERSCSLHIPLTPPSTAPASGDQSQSDSTPAATQPATEEPIASAPVATAQPLPTASKAQETATDAETTAAGEGETHKGIPVGFTTEGYPYRGSPDAPITMYEYSDFQCPYCNRYFIQTEPALDESYVRSGEVRVIFRDFPLAELHPNAPPAHVAALCVADQGAALYWAMHARLFQAQSAWNQLPDPASYFADLAAEVGVDMDQYDACMASGEKEAVVAQGVADAREKGFSGTPSFLFVREATDEAFPLVGAQPYDQFAGMIDTLVAGGTPQTADQAQGNDEIPFWATAEGLQPDPERPGVNMAGDYYRGNPEAKVVVIEFSDLQCPFCRRHSLETQPVLDEEFVATEQVLWVFKHFPLTIHPQAPAAGIASECAADQGKFWEMHELLFQNVQSWSITDPTPVFVDLAQQLELDLDQFTPCLESESAAQRVQEDLEAGTPFVRGTPTFIVLYNGQGSIIPGALPADRFTSILQEVLDSVAQ